MPYIFDAFRHPVYGIRSISNLFNPVSYSDKAVTASPRNVAVIASFVYGCLANFVYKSIKH